MRKLLLLVMTVVLLGPPLAGADIAGGPDSEAHQLKKCHKEQRKTLKQQRAMENVASQHPEWSEARQRFKYDMKMQQQMLRKKQKDETHN